MNKNRKSTHPQWALAHKKQGTELRCINNRYYLYEYKTVYDATLKRARKITGKILGSITKRDGFIPSATRIANSVKRNVISMPVIVKEYGVSQLVFQRFKHYSQPLAKFFPEHWKYILAIAYCRFIYRCPLKGIPYRIESSFMPELFEMPPFNEKTSSMILNQVGKMQINRQEYMKSFIRKGEYVLVDGTYILSSSNQIDMARWIFR